MSNSTFKIPGFKGILFSVLVFVVLIFPKYLFFGSLGFALFSIINDYSRSRKLVIPVLYWVLISTYLLYAVYLFWTDDFSRGAKDLEHKLLFFAGPLLFLFIDWRKSDLISLTYGFNIVMFMIVGYRLYEYFFIHNMNEGWFTYKTNSGEIHPSYMAMYSTMAFFMGLQLFVTDFKKLSTLKDYFLKFVLMIFMAASAVYVVMVGSKAGVINFVLVLFPFVLYHLLTKMRVWLRIVGVVFTLLIFIFSVNTLLKTNAFSYGLEKVDSYFEDREAFIEAHQNESESNASRLLVWDVAVDLIKENPMGVGSGDVRNVMADKYLSHGLVKLYELKLNPHNQYLQSLLGLGILGLLLLLFVFIFPIILGAKRHFPLLMILGFMVTFNATVESILELQVGIFFFVFFLLIFDQISREQCNES